MSKESKRDKFVRLAENRTQGVLKGIDLLGNLVNPSAYDYTKKDLEKIVKAIREATDGLEAIYDQAINRTQNKFKL